MTPLCQFLLKYGSDKVPVINHSYSPFYHFLFKDRRLDVRSLLEIGVGFPEAMDMVQNYRRGASLYAFRDYFPNAEINAIDIREDTLFQDERIRTFLCDQTKAKDLRILANHIGGNIDIVIDDGDHARESQVTSAVALMPFVKQWYIIEDVSDPDWVYTKLKSAGLDPDVITFNAWAPDDRLIIIRKK